VNATSENLAYGGKRIWQKPKPSLGSGSVDWRNNIATVGGRCTARLETQPHATLLLGSELDQQWKRFN
jgi:hypothetical protein